MFVSGGCSKNGSCVSWAKDGGEGLQLFKAANGTLLLSGRFLVSQQPMKKQNQNITGTRSSVSARLNSFNLGTYGWNIKCKCKTAETPKTHIWDKLGLKNTAEPIKYAIKT